MISPMAVERYLDRPLDDWDWLPDLDDGDLDRELAGAGIPEGTIRSLWRHQRECLLVGIHRPRLALFLDMGLGKTRTAIEILKAHGIVRALVLVPYSVLTGVWRDELARWAPRDRHEAVTFEAFRRRVCSTEDGRMVLDLDLLHASSLEYDATIIDESGLIGNASTLITMAAIGVSQGHRVRLALSGTPFGRDPMSLWPQMEFVDRGETLGSLGMFRSVFFRRSDDGQWEFRRGLAGELRRVLRHRSLRRRAGDCLDLPPRRYQAIRYPMPKEAEAAYLAMRDGLLEYRRRGESVEAKACFIRLRQLTSGFLYDSEEGEARTVIDYGLDARVEAAAAVAAQTSGPVVVFHVFRALGDALLARMDDAGDDPEGWLAGDFRTLVISAAAGAYGGNFQRADTVVFAETPTAPAAREQAERRIWRAGQDRPVIYYDIMADGGIDDAVHASLARGRDLVDEIMEGGRIP